MRQHAVIDYSDLPKVELHVHLDTSLSYTNILQFRSGLSAEEYRSVYVAPRVCADLHDFLRYPEPSIALLQHPEAVNMALRQLLRELAHDKVIYAEIRFAPLLHTRSGTPAAAIVDAACQALREGNAETGVEARLLLCTLRHFTAEQGLETVQLVEEFRHQGVVGLDLAADETGYSLNPHIPAFQRARELKIPTTAHAGEAGGPESVLETLEFLGPRRIGHGVRSIEDPDLVQLLVQKQIHLEICPSSNLQTRVFDHITDHSIDPLARAGVSVSINTDGRGLTDTTLHREYALVAAAFGWEKADFQRCNIQALQAAFCSSETKQRLLPLLETGTRNS